MWPSAHPLHPSAFPWPQRGRLGWWQGSGATPHAHTRAIRGPTARSPMPHHLLLLVVVAAPPAAALSNRSSCGCLPTPSHCLLAHSHTSLQAFPGQMLRRRRRQYWQNPSFRREEWCGQVGQLKDQVVHASPALHGFSEYLAGGEKVPHGTSGRWVPPPQGETMQVGWGGAAPHAPQSHTLGPPEPGHSCLATCFSSQW